MAAAAGAESGAKGAGPRTAVPVMATGGKVYAAVEPAPEPCATPTANEIVVCAKHDEPPDQRLTSPTDRAYAAGEMPPDPVPRAPDVFGLPPCRSYTFCAKVGRTPPPIYIIDLSKIPEPLTPEEAALVFRAEEAANPEAASPTAAR